MTPSQYPKHPASLFHRSVIMGYQSIKCGDANIVVAGGVAANEGIRNILNKVSKENGFKTLFPDLKLCGDNGAMIAMVGLEKFKLKQFNNLDYPAKPRWPLDENATFLKGAGVKL